MLIYLPNYDMVMDIHDTVLEVSGGRAGIRDTSAIDAAIHRPKTYLAYHTDCDIHTVCAVLIDSIARNHAFIDGNKRTGLMTALLTYELNDIGLNMDADKYGEFEELVLWIVNDKPGISEIASRLKELTDKYKINRISKFINSVKSALSPFETKD